MSGELSNIVVAFIAAAGAVIAAVIALKKDRQIAAAKAEAAARVEAENKPDPEAKHSKTGQDDVGVIQLLLNQIKELSDRDVMHDRTEALLWTYIRQLQFWGATADTPVPRRVPKPPAALLQATENQSEPVQPPS